MPPTLLDVVVHWINGGAPSDGRTIHSAAVWTVPPQITHVNRVTLGGSHPLLPFGVTLFGLSKYVGNSPNVSCVRTPLRLSKFNLPCGRSLKSSSSKISSMDPYR